MSHEEISLLRRIIRLLEELLDYLRPQNYAQSAILSTQGADMATTATLTFVDANGVAASPPKGDGSGLVVTFASDNPNVSVSAATASGDTATALISGTEAFNLSATVANSSGAELLDDDGTTPFVQPSPIAVEAPPPPQATSATLSAS